MKDSEIMNLVDDSLSALYRKGNLEYAAEMYNPSNYFKCVHHISFKTEDRKIKIGNDTIKVHVLKTTRKFLPYFWVLVDFFLCFVQILYLSQKYKVCLIRGRGPHYASFFGLIVSKVTGIPFVVSVGGNHRLARELSGRYPVFNSRFIDFKIEEIVLKNADMVICPNYFSRQYVIKIGTAEHRTVVIPLRLKDDIFNFTYEESDILLKKGVNLCEPIILFVGRFEKDKQVDVLIETVPLIIKNCPNAQFIFIGDGSLMTTCKKRTSDVGILKNTYFLGFQPTEIVKYCIKVASLVWVPMSGFVIFEAATAAKPIIAFDVEWHSEFIENGKTGLLVENRNYQKLAEAVITLIKNPDLREKLGISARKLLEEKYNPDMLAKKEIEVLSNLISNRSLLKWRL